MTKGFGTKLKKTGDAFLSSTVDNVREKYDGVVQKLKEDPFEIIDIEMIDSVVDDPFGFLKERLTDKEFLGEMIGTAIECIPYVGPILSSVFGMFWPQDPKMKTITAKELEEKLSQFKGEMLKAMDEKIEASEKETWKDLCKTFFDGYVFKVSQMKKSIVILKKEIEDNKGVIDDVPEATKERIRVTFLSLLESANNISNFCKKQKITGQVLDIYIQAILLQCATTIQLCSFWYQISLDKYFILGIKKSSKSAGAKSVKEEYHDLLAECLKNITPAVYKNILDKNEKLNKYYNDNASKMFNTNPWLYQLPLVIAPLNIPKVATGTRLIPTINVPSKRKTPFIYRIDGANMIPEQSREGQLGYRHIPIIDPLTKCHGAIVNIANSININEVTELVVANARNGGEDKVVDSVQNSLFCLPVIYKQPNNYKMKVNQKEWEYLDKYGAHSGFTTLKQFKNVDFINFHVWQNNFDQRAQAMSCVKFIELIISDISKEDLEIIKKMESEFKEYADKIDKINAKKRRLSATEQKEVDDLEEKCIEIMENEFFKHYF
ncbi:hypothetical protein CYY_001452 [Polysphondylium violaceum]|uniref:Pesticidal crystal protein N-terminal domain-containing protein n=1 Tax=Polysphondylium violaceum TaxID=133409 RepID=A0A8J4V467_9MYCE|nr:hypothetical protein CYY_001452 [Polysphondylium violaceum]